MRFSIFSVLNPRLQGAESALVFNNGKQFNKASMEKKFGPSEVIF
jgi:hypothetical protein